MVLSKETLLRYPDFSKEFEIHTDASQSQIGAVIAQADKPIAFYSRRLTDCQTRYTTTERELLAIVETLKEFRNILLGQKIVIHTDHKNLTYDSFNTDRVMKWRLILEEYGPELIYVKGQNNIVADPLSRLDLKKESILESTQSTMNMAEIFGLDSSDHDDTTLPIPIHPDHHSNQPCCSSAALRRHATGTRSAADWPAWWLCRCAATHMLRSRQQARALPTQATMC